jgi:hypothetical protein
MKATVTILCLFWIMLIISLVGLTRELRKQWRENLSLGKENAINGLHILMMLSGALALVLGVLLTNAAVKIF